MEKTVLLHFNWADFAIIAVVCVSVLISFARGFVRECLSIITWIAAFWVAFVFSKSLSAFLVSQIHTASTRAIVSFVILFLLTLFVGGMINFSIVRLIVHTGLSGTDRVLGMIFGFLRGVLLVGIFLLLVSFTSFVEDTWWKQSTLIPHFHPLLVWLKGFLPSKALV
jgi:membrane protein required for colicin V production